MNLDTYKEQLIKFASRLNEKPFDSPAAYVNFENNVCRLLDEYYETYLNATVDERKEIRQIIKEYDRSEKYVYEGGPLPNPLRCVLNRYGIRAIKQIETTGNVIWLMRGLVAISILNGIHYQPDDKEHLARLFVAAEEKGLNPKPVFQLISEISSNEPSKPGEISTSELIAISYKTAHEIVDEMKTWFKVDEENE